MVQFSARFLFSVIYLSTQASHLLASAACCEGDTHCSGCWMCKGSELRDCWDQATASADSCASKTDLWERLECLCKGYSQIALCWSKGTCCTEYAPTLSAAVNLCNLKTYPKDQLTEDLVSKVENDAYKVRNTIWHNDSGYNVPKMSVYIKAYSNNEQQTYHTQSTSSKPQDKYSMSHRSSFENEGSKHEDTSHYQTKSVADIADNNNNNSNKLENVNPVEKLHQDYNSQKHQVKPQSHASSHQLSTPDHKVHHQAKCSPQQHKCQAEIANQYHKARRNKSNKKLGKRGTFSAPGNAEIYKRSQRVNSKGESECGIDFQGVAYPSQVPPTVAKMFAEL